MSTDPLKMAITGAANEIGWLVLHNEWNRRDRTQMEEIITRHFAPVVEEMKRLKIVEQEFKLWCEKTEWVQTEHQWGLLEETRAGIHRADVIRTEFLARREELRKLNQKLTECRDLMYQFGSLVMNAGADCVPKEIYDRYRKALEAP